MHAKRKSTLGTRVNTEAPSRSTMTNILKLLAEVETNDGPRGQHAKLNSTCKKPKTNRVPTQTSSYRQHAKEKPVNRKLYKRPVLKPTDSTTAHKKENSPCPESIKKLMLRSKNTEETTAVTGGLRLMRERAAKARATRILSTPNNTNIVRKGETLGNRTPKIQSHMPLAQLTPQNEIFTKYKSDLSCSVDKNNITKRKYKSTAFEFLPHDTGCFQAKQKLISVNENKMDDMNTDVLQSHLGNENQEKLALACQKAGTSEFALCSLDRVEQQKENITHFFPSALTSASLLNPKPSFLHSNSSQNFTSACNGQVAVSQSKINTPRLNHIPPLPSGYFKTPTSSLKIFSTEMLSVKSQASEPKPNASSCCGNTENILKFSSEATSVMQRNNNDEINACSSMDAKDAKVTNKTEVNALKEDITQGAACSLKEPQIMEIIRNLLTLHEQYKAETNLYMEKINAIQNQQSEMLQKLSTIYQVEDETDKCKQSASFTVKSKASSSTDCNTEMELAEPEKILVPVSEVSGHKKRRSSRIAAKMSSSIHSIPCTPDPYDKNTTVVAIFKDLRKSFTFLRTPRGGNTSPQARTPARTPRTIVSTTVQNQLQLLYDTDSPE